MKQFSELGIKPDLKRFVGEKIDIRKIFNTEITLHDFEIGPSKFPDRGNGKCLKLQITHKNEMRVVFSGSGVLMNMAEKIDKAVLPVRTTIVEENEHHEFR